VLHPRSHPCCRNAPPRVTVTPKPTFPEPRRTPEPNAGVAPSCCRSAARDPGSNWSSLHAGPRAPSASPPSASRPTGLQRPPRSRGPLPRDHPLPVEPPSSTTPRLAAPERCCSARPPFTRYLLHVGPSISPSSASAAPPPSLEPPVELSSRQFAAAKHSPPPAPFGKESCLLTSKTGPPRRPLAIGGPSGAPSRRNRAAGQAAAAPASSAAMALFLFFIVRVFSLSRGITWPSQQGLAKTFSPPAKMAFGPDSVHGWRFSLLFSDFC
jgi:hypothetical protein